MRKLLCISLLFVLSFECFSNIYVWAGYEINKGYISHVLCVNRDNPSMHCDGKCFLEKQLQENQQRKSDESGALGNWLDIVLMSPDATPAFSPALHSSDFTFSPYKSASLPAVYSDFFHPPKAS